MTCARNMVSLVQLCVRSLKLYKHKRVINNVNIVMLKLLIVFLTILPCICMSFMLPIVPITEHISSNQIEHVKTINNDVTDKKYRLSIEDTTIILNSLHYYKKVENKKGNFKQYDTDRINALRDRIVDQMVHDTDTIEDIHPQCDQSIFHF